jgi:hypothetical protein
MKTAKLLLSISPFFVLIPLAVLFFRFSYLTTPLKWIGAYILLCAATGFISYALWCMHANNLWILPIQATFELPFLFLALYKAIADQKTKPLIFSIIILFVLFSTINSICFQPLFSYNAYSETIGSTLIIGYCIYYFIDLIKQMKVTNLGTTPMFWIASSVLLYYASSLFLYGMRNSIVNKSSSLNMWIWVFHAFLTGLHYSLLSVGLWRSKTT